MSAIEIEDPEYVAMLARFPHCASAIARTPPMLSCGCAANAKDARGEPCCVLHDAHVVPTPNLAGRDAVCRECDQRAPSSMRLGFFAHVPASDVDAYYCGCRGSE